MLQENILENYIKNNLSKVFVKQKYSVGFLTVLVKIGKKNLWQNLVFPIGRYYKCRNLRVYVRGRCAVVNNVCDAVGRASRSS